ncbi:uroporphyrinogen-III synthase [Chlamydia abortus]|uniref:uroporphyrinogen-III synthase n=1 Tax=Paenibacillus sp. 32O-W TaxID=1695218 RepID=UPI000A27E997|nr:MULTISPECIES: uroporphyrinogen-III synthase [Paenibacillaceae]SHE09866.1 uroporphyrinogen-III synthase [Chlamydia abortus]
MAAQNRPLSGLRILVTRTREQSGELAGKIEELGGQAIVLPVIRLQPPTDPVKLAELEQAIRELDKFDWVIFTSVNAVIHFFNRLEQFEVEAVRLQRSRIVAVGPKTAGALLARGLVAYKVPERYQAEDLFEAIAPELKPGQKVLFPRSDLARKVLPDRLNSLGLKVTEIDIYENKLCTDHADILVDLLVRGEIDVVTLTSPSTFRNILTLIRTAGAEPDELLTGVKLACIGQVTARAVQEAGWSVHYLAEEATIDSLVQVLIPAGRE